ncbi:MAG: TetR/AcrR family transcriptional regulator [Alphaproteobacteria bacterium]
MQSGRRDHLVHIARKLFYENGFHAVGIDRILAESGVSKTTLYKHFHSKDALVAAALKSWADYLKERLDRILIERGQMPITRLESLFVLNARMCKEKGFNGDMFINAMSEYNDKDHIVRQTAQELKESMWAWIFEAVKEARVAEPKIVARQIVILYEGTVSALQIARDTAVSDFARGQVRSLIASAKKIA